MKILAENVEQKLKVPCYYPPNHKMIDVPTLKDGGAAKWIDIFVDREVLNNDEPNVLVS